MDGILKLSSKNQLTLPVSIVSSLNLAGAKLWTRVIGKTVVIEKIDDSWDDLQGILANHPLSKKYTTLEIVELAKKKEAKRLAEKNEL